MTVIRSSVPPEGASRLPPLPVRILRAAGSLFVSLFLSTLSAEERARQAAAGEAPVFNVPPDEGAPWPSCLFDQHWPR